MRRKEARLVYSALPNNTVRVLLVRPGKFEPGPFSKVLKSVTIELGH
jgi:hypothetical protein